MNMKRFSFLAVVFIGLCASVSAQSTSFQNSAKLIDRYSGSLCWMGSKSELTDDECHAIFDLGLYSTYRSAQEQFYKGSKLLTLGFVSLGTGIVSSLFATNGKVTEKSRKGLTVSSIILTGVGEVCVIAGCIMKISGRRNIEWVKETYNNKAFRQTSSRISLSPSLMMTAQSDLGYGATLSVCF